MDIASSLQLYGLKKDHIKLIEWLLPRSDRKFMVRELARAAELPVTRAYGALAELADMGLVERTFEKKLKFGMPDSEDRFRKFFAERATEGSAAQRIVFDAIGKHALRGSDLVLLPTRDEFYQAIYQLFTRANCIKMLSRSQWGVIPDNSDVYWRTQAWKLLKERISGGLDFFYVVDEAAVRKSLAGKQAAAVRRNIAWLQRQPSVRLVSAGIQHSVSTIITDSAALMGFRCTGERQTAQGLIIRNRDFLNFSDTFYGDLFKSGRALVLPRTGASR